MGPQNFRNFDKRKFHIKDVADVLDWLDFVGTRNEEARKVVMQLRNSEALQKSIVANQQRQMEKGIVNRVSEPSTVQGSEPGAVQTTSDIPSDTAEDETILSELRETIEAENLADQETEEADEVDQEQLAKFSYYEVKLGQYRYRYENKLVKAVDVPPAIMAVLVKRQQESAPAED